MCMPWPAWYHEYPERGHVAHHSKCACAAGCCTGMSLSFCGHSHSRGQYSCCRLHHRVLARRRHAGRGVRHRGRVLLVHEPRTHQPQLPQSLCHHEVGFLLHSNVLHGRRKLRVEGCQPLDVAHTRLERNHVAARAHAGAPHGARAHAVRAVRAAVWCARRPRQRRAFRGACGAIRCRARRRGARGSMPGFQAGQTQAVAWPLHS
mmetsp:Transcript_329/g.848  ORF Transcript_329/g.848 Transcript_329/m.848 type:complete len:205 (-) Transcript_329:1880-2494(-)